MPDNFAFTQPRTPRRPSALRRFFTMFAIVAVVVGAGLGALVWNGNLKISGIDVDSSLSSSSRIVRNQSTPALPIAGTAAAGSKPGDSAAAPTVEMVESRLAELEQRLSRLDLQATAASGNAARAEGLLIAFAARRTIDRGAPLGYLEDQLRLRFADAQPNAVATIIDGAAKQITLDRLIVQLQMLAPKLTGLDPGNSFMAKARHEIASLFVIRKDRHHVLRPQDRIERAKLLLAEGKTAEAVAQVELLPGVANAGAWITSARRYDDVHRALDLIETTAMLEPHRLQDSAGEKVDQPSPLVGTTEG